MTRTTDPQLPRRTVAGVEMEYCGGRAWRCAAHKGYVTADCSCCAPPVPECCAVAPSTPPQVLGEAIRRVAEAVVRCVAASGPMGIPEILIHMDLVAGGLHPCEARTIVTKLVEAGRLIRAYGPRLVVG